MTQPDRPVARSRPRPPVDEGTDPIVSPMRAAPAPAPSSSVRRGPEPTVQLNVRIGAEINALVDEAQVSHGWTKRQIVEHAIKQAFSQAR